MSAATRLSAVDYPRPFPVPEPSKVTTIPSPGPRRPHPEFTPLLGQLLVELYYPESADVISYQRATELLGDPNRVAHIMRIAELGHRYLHLDALMQPGPLDDTNYTEIADSFALWYIAAAPHAGTPPGRSPLDAGAYSRVWLPRPTSTPDYRAQQSVAAHALTHAERQDIANWRTEGGVIIHSLAAADLYRRLHHAFAMIFANSHAYAPFITDSLRAVDPNKQAVCWLAHDTGRLITHHPLEHMFFSAVINGELGLPPECRKDEDLPTLLHFEKPEPLFDPRDVEGILRAHGIVRVLGYIADVYTKFYHISEDGYQFSLANDQRRKTAEILGRRSATTVITQERRVAARQAYHSLQFRLRRPDDTITFLRSRAQHYLAMGEIENQRSYERQADFLQALLLYCNRFPHLLWHIHFNFSLTERYKHAMMRRYAPLGMHYSTKIQS